MYGNTLHCLLPANELTLDLGSLFVHFCSEELEVIRRLNFQAILLSLPISDKIVIRLLIEGKVRINIKIIIHE